MEGVGRIRNLLILFAVIAAIALLLGPVARADDTVSELGCSTQGFATYFEEAALVGKIVDYEVESGKYIIYGRLSTCEGYDGIWRVFQMGRFYEALAANGVMVELMPEYLGQGVKLFGSMETGKEGRNILLARNLIPYDPTLDLQAGALPAWTEGSEPDQQWIGFGIQTSVYTACLYSFSNPADLVLKILPLKHVLESGGRSMIPGNEDNGRVVIFDPESGASFNEMDVARVWGQDPYRSIIPDFIPNSSDRGEVYRRLLLELGQTYPFTRVDFLIGSDAGLQQAVRSVGGYCWINAMKGINNSYLLSIPIIRPDLDAYMDSIEALDSGDGFSEWASPALFYGTVVPHYREKNDSDGIGNRVYDYAVFNGVYFPGDDPRGFLERILAGSRGEVYEGGKDDSQVGLNRREQWRLEGLNEAEALVLQAQNHAWIVGTRCLEYVYTPPDGRDSETIIINQGSRKTEPGYSLKDHYIVAERHQWQGGQQVSALSRGELNFLLNCMRDMAFQGGF